MARKKRTEAELGDTLLADAELERVRALTSDDLNAELRRAGFDAGVGARGAARAKELLAARSGGWKDAARTALDTMAARVRDRASYAAMARDELLALLDAARGDARYGAVVASFHKRPDAEASDDELRDLLEQLDVVRRLDEKE
jgi:hypothetical protein